MNVAILGFSVLDQSENLPIYRYFKAKGATITAYYWGGDAIRDAMPADITKIAVEGADAIFDDLDAYDLVVRSPIVHPKQIKTTTTVTTLTNLFMNECPAKVIGVTGTKGKGTTSTLIANILRAAGKHVVLGGNIGTPLLDKLPEITADTWVVNELSSFQLIDAEQSPHIAVCVMVVPEHLDWHTDVAEYYTAKKNIFVHQKATDRAVYNANNQVSTMLAQSSPAAQTPYDVPAQSADEPLLTNGAYVADDTIYMQGTKVCKVSDVALLGRHNLENVCAAIAAVWDIVAGDVAVITSAVSSFTGLEHRLEFVRDVDGVSFYNDSFSTTPETAIAAIQAFSQPKVLILGGHNKGIPFDGLAAAVVAHNVRHVVAIGDTADTITKLIQDLSANRTVSVTNFGSAAKPSITDIVAAAQQHAQPGDVVLLSTGCASYGLFENYKERGKAFKAAVQAL